MSDPTFGEEILGKGVAIRPTANQRSSPCDATVDLMFDTGHAVSLRGTTVREMPSMWGWKL
ncbi:MAG: PTS glucose transporter subunit IIA [Oscillospiraceae bacterium]